ncbi:MAG: hypothetical protein DHS20C08_02890 [Rhodomicrobium sp.]|nr:MAG: hypothetical protein DHS20C08_02890 [Rhodomicrobium sp.]
MSASWNLQTALIAALKADATLQTLLGGARIYDTPPFRARLPYITLGMTLERDWSTSTEQGGEHIITFHSWTEMNSRQQAMALEEAVRDLIENTSISITGHILVNARYQFSEIRRDREGSAYHGIIRYRLVTEPV